ncbi:hypothetical protein [Pseudoduganella umbonata]|uniref:Uncharacterized protein n=1 Tax=Pseudoduganella umbonata TaxID=864828 RepID=A0A4V1ED12_9BURK|nr:hypothetical protein [Pseudoduganella umbonata]MBB3219378.1 hypothetical protein [Pseudoduganella umbonata]QCP09471.1 hypothetical protein FCL38_02840 [Pseudoduganella umbonata]
MTTPWLPLPRASMPASFNSAPARRIACLMAGFATCLGAPVLAADAAGDRGPADWAPVAEHVLAEARGGFDTGDGLLVSLSVDRVLSLNGDVVASGQLSMDAPALSGQAALSALQMAHIGEGGALLGTAQPLAGLVLQNSASDQLIRSQTTIEATVNSLSILKDMHFGDSLHQALSTAILPR